VTFIVPKLELAARAAEALGYEVVGYNDAYASWKECFLHPKQALGIVVQMAEKSDEPDAANPWGVGFAFPRVGNASSMARIVALRMSAPSNESAIRQWGELLGGELTTPTEGVLEFRWRESPIGLVVEIEASRTAGPKHLEVAFDERVTLPTEPNPSLGTRFVTVVS
jgi:hypothetical protein